MITSHEVHFTIQQMNNTLQVYDKSIAVNALAENLRINTNELLPHLDTLLDMYYIKYTDRKHEKIRLTLTGQYTIVPQD